MSPLTFHLEPLDVAGADEDGLERPQGEVVVRLPRELLLAQLEQRHKLLAQLPRRAEPLREQHHLRDQRPIRLGHGLIGGSKGMISAVSRMHNSLSDRNQISNFTQEL